MRFPINGPFTTRRKLNHKPSINCSGGPLTYTGDTGFDLLSLTAGTFLVIYTSVTMPALR